jgi:hypothetical protein
LELVHRESASPLALAQVLQEQGLPVALESALRVQGLTLDLKEVDPHLGQALSQAQDMGRLAGQGGRVLRMLMAALIVLEGVKSKMRF